MTPRIHPVDLEDLPEFVLLAAYGHLIPLEQRSLQTAWQRRYPFIGRRGTRDLWIDVRKCDKWLDERGKGLFSTAVLGEKKRRNPGWLPAGERLAGFAGSSMDELANILLRKIRAGLSSGSEGAV